MGSRFCALLVSAPLCFTSLNAGAALQGRLPKTPGGTDYQAIYDVDQNITWLADGHLAATDTFGLPGISPSGDTVVMTWPTAQSWIDALNASQYLGVSEWRMPATKQPDPTCAQQYVIDGYPLQGWSYNCTGSEMGYLFYRQLGGVATLGLRLYHNANYGLFTHIDGGYWSDTLAYYSDGAWGFCMCSGRQKDGYKTAGAAEVWVVTPGDPFATVPLPSSAFLFPSALAALGWVRRCKRDEWIRGDRKC